MRKYIPSLLGVLLSVIITTPTWADDNTYNDCERLHIQIGNLRSNACTLVKTNVIHGNLMSAPPATIPPGFSADFDMTQTFFGPNVELEYSCDGEHIKFGSQQNYCFMAAGGINATIIDSSMNIHASVSKEVGSYFWSKPGIVNWVLS